MTDYTKKIRFKAALGKNFRENVVEFFTNYILIEIPEDINCWVAGGALRDFYLYGHIKGETDIDIFVSKETDYFRTVSALKEFYNVKKETDFAITLTDKDDDEKIVQVIKKFYKDPTACIMSFDLTCCCAYVGQVGGSIHYQAAEEFYDDNFHKKLKIINLNESPTAMFARIKKYVKKGFTIENSELLDMAKGYINGDTNLDELVETYESLTLRSNTPE